MKYYFIQYYNNKYSVFQRYFDNDGLMLNQFKYWNSRFEYKFFLVRKQCIKKIYGTTELPSYPKELEWKGKIPK